MKSTFTFKEKRLPILSVQDVNLVYKLAIHRNYTWRDTFTNFSKKPLETINPGRERFHVLKDINFDVYQGERIGLLGVNGAGKSSLCRCLAGMYLPSTGRIHCHAPVRAIFNTGIGIQPELTGKENAMLLAHFLFPGDPALEEIVEEALVFSELGRFIDVPYKLYSSGMQARLYLSLISSRSTGLLILDEVFDGADVFFREKISARVMTMIESSGAAIFVSHSFEQIKRVCNRVIILHKSQMVFDGVPDKAISHYQNLRPAASQ